MIVEMNMLALVGTIVFSCLAGYVAGRGRFPEILSPDEVLERIMNKLRSK